MKDFISDEDAPPYAVLSHTWCAEEITFQQWTSNSLDIKTKEGYIKMEYCLKQARQDRLSWAWVDT
jgi:hypothetical protein